MMNDIMKLLIWNEILSLKFNSNLITLTWRTRFSYLAEQVTETVMEKGRARAETKVEIHSSCITSRSCCHTYIRKRRINHVNACGSHNKTASSLTYMYYILASVEYNWYQHNSILNAYTNSSQLLSLQMK